MRQNDISSHSGDSTASSLHDASIHSRSYNVIRNIAESREKDELFGQGTTSSPSQFSLGNSRSFSGLRQSDAESEEIQINDVKDEKVSLESASEIKSHEKENMLSSLKYSITGVIESVDQYIPKIPVPPIKKLTILPKVMYNTWQEYRYESELDKLRNQRRKEFKERRKQRELDKRYGQDYTSER